jgi:O-antigen ligase
MFRGGADVCAPTHLVGFILFILVNAVLFIRPAEIIDSLEDWPIYEILIIACLVASLPAIFEQLMSNSLVASPVTVCVFGILSAIVLSHLSNLSIYGARTSGYEFAKVVAYYVLFIGLVNTPSRLRWFLMLLVGFTVVLAGLALLQYHGVINIPALEAIEQTDIDEETGDIIVFYRLCSTGIYNDPNDLCLILVTGIVICLYWLTNRGSSLLWRLSSIPLLGLFGYALSLTQSRGGFIALLAALLVLFRTRFSFWKTVPLAAVVLPAMFFLFAGRQTKIDIGTGDTMQARIQLWSEGLELFREAPVFGIGQGEYAEEVGGVAHNSFVHCYAELGFFGGTLFLGAFFSALSGLIRLGRSRVQVPDFELMRLCPYVITMVAAYAAGMLSLSRSYIVPTYMVLGLGAAYLRLASAYLPAPVLPFSGQLALRVVAASAASVVGIYVFVRVFAQYG